MGGDLRCFLAVDLPEPLLHDLTDLQGRLGVIYPHLRRVKRENLHLTLHFLGNVSREIMERIVAECRPLTTNHRAFAVRIGELGVFPRWSEPTVVWLSLNGDMEPLSRLYRQTGAIIEKTGLKTDNRPFRPHITLARTPAGRREGLDPAVLRNCSRGNRDALCLLSSFTLYTSELRREGPVYRPYYRFELNKDKS